MKLVRARRCPFSRLDPLIQARKDKENKSLYVRETATWALGNIGDARAVEPLTQALKDKNWDVRWGAAEVPFRLKKD